jgi:hypothetical protein
MRRGGFLPFPALTFKGKKMKTKTSGRRLSPKEINDALYYYHLYDGNASKVAKKLETSVATITRLAERENFAGKSALVQHRINEMVYKTDDVQLQNLMKADIKILEMGEMLVDQMHRAIKRKTLKFRSPKEALEVAKAIIELRKMILGPSNGEGQRTPNKIPTIGTLNLIGVDPDKQKQLLKVLERQASFVDAEGELVDA